MGAPLSPLPLSSPTPSHPLLMSSTGTLLSTCMEGVFHLKEFHRDLCKEAVPTKAISLSVTLTTAYAKLLIWNTILNLLFKAPDSPKSTQRSTSASKELAVYQRATV